MFTCVRTRYCGFAQAIAKTCWRQRCAGYYGIDGEIEHRHRNDSHRTCDLSLARSGHFRWLYAATSLGVYALRSREADGPRQPSLARTSRADSWNAGLLIRLTYFEGRSPVYERQIVRLRQQLNEPLSLQGRFNLRAQIGQYEEELRDFRAFACVTLNKAPRPFPPIRADAATPETVGGAAVGTSRKRGRW